MGILESIPEKSFLKVQNIKNYDYLIQNMLSFRQSLNYANIIEYIYEFSYRLHGGNFV